MAFEKRGLVRAALIALFAWPLSGSAQTQEAIRLPPHSGSAMGSPSEDAPMSTLRHLEAVQIGALHLGGRGVEYRSAFQVGRRTLPYRVWGGRAHNQVALGFDFEPVFRRQKLRFGAYGSQREVGLAMRLRY